jgi:hypothetical protein
MSRVIICIFCGKIFSLFPVGQVCYTVTYINYRNGEKKVGGQGTAERMWRIVFPILLYVLFSMLYPELLRIASGGRMSEPAWAMWLLTAVNLLMLPVFWLLYQRERREYRRKHSFCLKDMLLVILGSVCLSRGINYFLALTFLPRLFPGYQEVSEGIYHCSFLSQIAAVVVSAPFLEEVLIRGIIYERLKAVVWNSRRAMVISAVIFGVFHGNVVQGLYAFVMGLFFVQVYEACDSLFLAVVAHIAANGASVLAGRYPWPDEFYRLPGVYYLLTAGFLMIGMLCWRYFLFYGTKSACSETEMY